MKSRSVNLMAFGAMVMVLTIPMTAFAAETTIRDLADILKNLESNLPFVRQAVVAFCYTLAIGFFARAVMMFKVYGQARTMMASNTSMAKPMIILFIGIGLFALPDLIDSGMATIYNYGSSSVMQYPAATNWSSIINPLVSIVKLLGLIVFVKGWIMLAKYGNEGGNQGGVAGKAILHMIGGLLAMNIVATIDIVKGTLGI